MKPNTAPRQMSDAIFVTGHAGISSAERSHRMADRVMLVLAAFVAGLALGGLL